MIGIRSAISIRARGQWPLLEAVYMTAPRSTCRNTKKALAERGPSIHDDWCLGCLKIESAHARTRVTSPARGEGAHRRCWDIAASPQMGHFALSPPFAR